MQSLYSISILSFTYGIVRNGITLSYSPISVVLSDKRHVKTSLVVYSTVLHEAFASTFIVRSDKLWNSLPESPYLDNFCLYSNHLCIDV